MFKCFNLYYFQRYMERDITYDTTVLCVYVYMIVYRAFAVRDI